MDPVNLQSLKLLALHCTLKSNNSGNLGVTTAPFGISTRLLTCFGGRLLRFRAHLSLPRADS